MRWWQKYLRKRMKPIPKDVARDMKKKLSFLYAFFAWNTFGFVLIKVLGESYPMTQEEIKKPALYYARIFQAENAEILQMDGFSVASRTQLEGVPELLPRKDITENNSVNEEPRDPELLVS